MCVCAHAHALRHSRVFSALQRERTSITLPLAVSSLSQLDPVHSVEVESGGEGGRSAAGRAALGISHSQIREMVTSSGPLDPAARLGSEAKTNQGLHKESCPRTQGKGVAECPAPFRIQISAQQSKSCSSTFRGPRPSTSILEPAAVITLPGRV